MSYQNPQQGTAQGARPNVPKKKFAGKAKSRQINSVNSTTDNKGYDKLADLILADPGDKTPGNKPIPPADPTELHDTSEVRRKFAGKPKGKK